jgi:hypothetical protein
MNTFASLGLAVGILSIASAAAFGQQARLSDGVPRLRRDEG